VSELNGVVVGWLGSAQLRRERASAVVGVFTLLGVASAVTSCGHYGVDLDGVVDASVDAGDETKDDKTTKPDKPKPGQTGSSDVGTAATSNGETGGKSEDPKTEYPSDGGKTSGETKDPASTEATASGSRDDMTNADAQAPKDASVDGSVLDDAGSDADSSLGTHEVDTNRDEETSTSQVSETRDGGTPICGPACSCAEGVDCNLVCVDESQCLASCELNALCDVVVGIAPTVKIDCASGALCSALDMTADQVNVTCEGEGDCHAECGGQQSCDVECKGPGRCVTKCHDDAACNVTCKEGADCYVVYDNVDNVTLDCAVGEVNHCAGVVTCDLPCP
jgi:hypothetical protein